VSRIYNWLIRAIRQNQNMADVSLRLASLALLFAGVIPAADVKASLGWNGFPDEGVEGHLLAGGSVRYHLTRHLAIEPEVLYLRGGRNHYDIVLMPNVVWQWGTARVRPYVTGGVGLMHSNFGGFSSNEGFVSVGFGTKVYLDERWFVAPEARIGWEPNVRFSVGLGYTWRP
jgi:hypothetical protein